MSHDFPKGWATASLAEITEINPRHPKALEDSIAVSFAPMAALSESNPELLFLAERRLGEVRRGFTHFAEGDVLFAKITPCMENGKGAVATGLRNRLGCGTTELHVLRPLCGIDPHYIYRFLAQSSIRQQAKEHFTSTAGQARVPTHFIEQLAIPLAPLNEQRRIVAKLEDLLGKVDACQRRLAKVSVLLKRFRQSVLAAACSGHLTADWRDTHDENEFEEKTVGDFCMESFYGPRFGQSEYVEDGIPTIRTTDFTDNGAIVLNDPPKVRVPKDKLPRFILRPGDLLVTRTGSIGKMAVFHGDYEAIPSAYLIRFRFSPAMSPDFVFCCLTAPRWQRLMGLGATAVTQPNINAETIKALPLPSPSLPEQQEIVRRVNALFALADRVEARTDKAQAHANQLTQSLLAKAFRGELVDQYPNDEPAPTLIERIKTEANSNPVSRGDRLQRK